LPPSGCWDPSSTVSILLRRSRKLEPKTPLLINVAVPRDADVLSQQLEDLMADAEKESQEEDTEALKLLTQKLNKLSFEQEEIIVAFKIDDNGQGFDLEQVQCHRAKDRRLGLATLDERAPHGRQPEDLKCQKHGDQHCL